MVSSGGAKPARAPERLLAGLPRAAELLSRMVSPDLERAVRGSVVLGLVGAGGIGIELKVAMDMLQDDLVVTIIAAMFLLVLLVELQRSHARKRMIR